jgi:hypothetical protein
LSRTEAALVRWPAPSDRTAEETADGLDTVQTNNEGRKPIASTARVNPKNFHRPYAREKQAVATVAATSIYVCNATEIK